MRVRSMARCELRASTRNPFLPLILLVVCASFSGCALTGKGSSSSGGGNPGADSPEISVTPTAASFGNVTVNADASQVIKISNAGTAALKISQAMITGTGFSMSGLTAPVTVAAGASVNFTVAFNPKAAGAGTGSISLTSNASESPTAINLTGTGVSVSLKLTASASSLSFGNVLVGSNTTQDVRLTNSGNADVVISSASAAGAGFSASGGSNLTLTPNQSATVAVSFDPQNKGALSGTLTVASNAPSLSIKLTGTGTQASLHSVSITWTPSTSSVIGYYVYRRLGSSGSFGKLASSVNSASSFTDSSVSDGSTYFYVVTAVSAANVESEFSAPVSVTIPSS